LIKRIKGDALREQESAINFDTTEQDLYYALTNVESPYVHCIIIISTVWSFRFTGLSNLCCLLHV